MSCANPTGLEGPQDRRAGPALRFLCHGRPGQAIAQAGAAASGNVPGVRFLILAWTGWAGTFWLFGGSTFSR